MKKKNAVVSESYSQMKFKGAQHITLCHRNTPKSHPEEISEGEGGGEVAVLSAKHCDRRNS